MSALALLLSSTTAYAWDFTSTWPDIARPGFEVRDALRCYAAVLSQPPPQCTSGTDTSGNPLAHCSINYFGMGFGDLTGTINVNRQFSGAIRVGSTQYQWATVKFDYDFGAWTSGGKKIIREFAYVNTDGQTSLCRLEQIISTGSIAAHWFGNL